MLVTNSWYLVAGNRSTVMDNCQRVTKHAQAVAILKSLTNLQGYYTKDFIEVKYDQQWKIFVCLK